MKSVIVGSGFGGLSAALRLRAKGENQANIENYVRRWFVFSILFAILTLQSVYTLTFI